MRPLAMRFLIEHGQQVVGEAPRVELQGHVAWPRVHARCMGPFVQMCTAMCISSVSVQLCIESIQGRVKNDFAALV